MAATVGNLVRRLKEFCILHDKKNRPIAKELKKIEEPLEDLLSFLHDAEWQRDNNFGGGKEPCNEKISNWVFSISRLAAEVEDIIVACDLHLLEIDINTGSLSRAYPLLRYVTNTKKDTVTNKIKGFLSRNPQISEIGKYISDGYWPKQSLLTDDLAKLIEKFSFDVTEKIKEFSWEATCMQLVRDISVQVTPTMLSHEPGNAIRTIFESIKLVGRQDEVERLQILLMEEQKHPGPLVIGVFGLGGIGKTTLVSVVNEQMQRNFDNHAWLFLSGKPTNLLQDMLRGILKSISIAVPSNIESMDTTAIIKLIRYWVSGKTLLVILDDIATEMELQMVRESLPGDCRAKILLTSRVHVQGCDYVLDLKSLKAQDAFYLLQKRTCLDNLKSSFWPSVKRESEEILNICKGLPLAIVTIGGMLSTKNMEIKEWAKVCHKLEKTNYLSLCYADLDPVLKSCFLYVASFPSDSVISCKRLERLWVAEGFVTQREGMMAEDVAKLQLYELIQRNLIQIVRVSKDGEVEMCRLLKPVRMFAIRQAQQEKFAVALDGSGESTWKEPRRLFFHLQYDHRNMIDREKINYSRLYSLLESPGYQYLDTSIKVSPDFKLLCVLDLHHLPSHTLPEAIANLVLLKYLGLRNTKILKLTKSLKKLRRLETLDIRDTLVKELPQGLEVLNKMKHLLLAGSFSDEMVNIKGDIKYFNDLLALSGVKLTEDIAQQLQNLSKLQKLSVGGVKSHHSKKLSVAIDKMKDIRSLTINCNHRERIYISSSNPLASLQKLKIGGQISNLLDWITKLRTIKYLYLWNNNLTNDPFPLLKDLPNLVLLSLCNTYWGEQIHTGIEGFPKLKKLSILYCNRLRRWVHEGGNALWNLEELTIAYCPKLMAIPQGLKELPSLVILELAKMPLKFVDEAKTQYSMSKFSILVRDTSPHSSQVMFDVAENSSNGIGKSKTS